MLKMIDSVYVGLLGKIIFDRMRILKLDITRIEWFRLNFRSGGFRISIFLFKTLIIFLPVCKTYFLLTVFRQFILAALIFGVFMICFLQKSVLDNGEKVFFFIWNFGKCFLLVFEINLIESIFDDDCVKFEIFSFLKHSVRWDDGKKRLILL